MPFADAEQPPWVVMWTLAMAVAISVLVIIHVETAIAESSDRQSVKEKRRKNG
jgi:hypothetical protein